MLLVSKKWLLRTEACSSGGKQHQVIVVLWTFWRDSIGKLPGHRGNDIVLLHTEQFFCTFVTSNKPGRCSGLSVRLRDALNSRTDVIRRLILGMRSVAPYM